MLEQGWLTIEDLTDERFMVDEDEAHALRNLPDVMETGKLRPLPSCGGPYADCSLENRRTRETLMADIAGKDPRNSCVSVECALPRRSLWSSPETFDAPYALKVRACRASRRLACAAFLQEYRQN